MINRLLVANRGEIAVRIIRAAFDEGIETVAVTSQADRDSLPAKLADRAVVIGPASAGRSYLDVTAVVSAALATGCDAIHPGYGFLSEQPALANACAENDLVFVGPSVDSLVRGGDKTASRELAKSLGIPVSEAVEPAADQTSTVELAAALGYPLIVKAAAGGGGRGMTLVHTDDELLAAIERGTREAQEAFGDGRVFVERFVTSGRHVEVQILGDGRGGVVHLGERDCSVQRRYQKVVEEAPASGLPGGLRTRLHESAVALGRELRYLGAGTVEFLVDVERGSYFFLEINTRVQVEHPVTEMLTGIDIVRAQLRLAQGGPLPAQADIELTGHAVEVRLTSEDPSRSFLPTPGRVTEWVAPQGSDVRVDTHLFPGYVVPPYYDSLLAKIIARGATREEAFATSARALRHVRVKGVQTNLGLLADLVTDPDFTAGPVTTRWLETAFMPSWKPREEPHG
ncbi:acetyl/propionyl/methylcrotonyl-CoA carboxylase subunit alpha [Amycolatopsis sp. Poz14]|uniref:acetyl-CoA carboxylase biotin carboxylase subunit n=1 Tax=Amycolatopsis sp. Poz14 TaxID=1447705 RepID=UPI001EE86E65|nr:biotin carboxylase N-terminal domain-containing protein [Amycolatopsis sp. Poz14]MCG3754013.1 ATP-grasp domain-containing protein [Amycolatopsis sp. Poz14]